MRRSANTLNPSDAQAHSLAVVRRARSVAALYVAATAVWCGCAGDATPTDDTADGDGQVTAEAPAPVVAPTIRDGDPPEFRGLDEVALLPDGAYQLSWTTATDAVSAPVTLRYEIFHTLEPFGEPDTELGPVATSEAGATTVTIRAPLETGRFFVRAIDEAGNRSGWGQVLEQRARRPWVRASDGTLLAELTECAAFEPGRAFCVGQSGYAARWDRDHWTRLEASDGANLRIGVTASGWLAFSPVGHVYVFAANGPLEPMAVGFDTEAPHTPIRQVTADFQGLTYWIDRDERVFVGIPGDFRPMARPVGVDAAGCATLRGLGFSATSGYAVCGDGAVYSVNAGEVGMRWLSLTANTPHALADGLADLRATNDTLATVPSADGLRRVGVGGWSTLLEPAEIGATRLGRPLRVGEAWLVPTDVGVFEGNGATWTLMPGTEGQVVGLIGPTALDPADQFTVIYADGAVASVRRGAIRWLIAPAPTGFEQARVGPAGIVALTSGATAGVFRHDGQAWERVDAAPDPTALADLAGLAVSSRGAVWMWGSGADGAGALLSSGGRGWTPATLRYPPPPPPEDPSVGYVFDEPLDPTPQPVPALRGLDAGRVGAPVPPMGPVVDADFGPDGRAVAATSDGQVWWRMDDGWLLVAQRPGGIEAIALDAGDSWVAVEAGRPIRCWRDQCTADVEQPANAPAELATTWHDAEGLVGLGPDGSLWRFAAAPWTDAAATRTTPAELTPTGAWTQVAEAAALGARGTPAYRVAQGDVDVVLTSEGAVSRRVDGLWVSAGARDDALLLVADGDDWALLTGVGLLKLGDVAPSRRPEP